MLANLALVLARHLGIGPRFRVGGVLVRRHGCRRRLAGPGDGRPDPRPCLAHGAARACLAQAALQPPDASDVRTGGSGLLARAVGIRNPHDYLPLQPGDFLARRNRSLAVQRRAARRLGRRQPRHELSRRLPRPALGLRPAGRTGRARRRGSRRLRLLRHPCRRAGRSDRGDGSRRTAGSRTGQSEHGHQEPGR